MQVLSKRNVSYTILLLAVLASNYALYRIPEMKPIPDLAVLGSFFDFLVVVPILIYFFIIRHRFSKKYIAATVVLGFGVASFIIPDVYFERFSFLGYIVIVPELLLIGLELYLIYFVIMKFPSLWKSMKQLQQDSSLFRINIQEVMSEKFKDKKFVALWVTEFSLFYYAFFSWRKKAEHPTGTMFTYHKQTSAIAVYVFLIHAIVLESIGFHFLVHQWSPIASYILLVFNIYGIIYFLAEIQAIRLTPFVLTDKKLYLYVGFAKGMSVDLNQINSIDYYQGPAKLSKDDQDNGFDARVTDMDLEPSKPTFVMTLQKPQELKMMYGFSRKVDRVFLNVDQQEAFYSQLKAALGHS
ncbi:hypothetical protein KO561_07180 [Radiobacillus kanasensis]|uniref:hypothetical protein n=1 Tax=Radiobacillus kanasensis TaxID=2844358 RepID=UPI001E595505|nr:hypothetical protein [Radiobacillus kanasensis]UFU00710.1 hypothetical protein KO561_07180 [Radiobacillus kanasensis]